MELSDRQMNILELVYEHKRMSVSKLAKVLYVTEMTVRRDLTEMESKGFVKRYHGGVMLPSEKEGFPVSQRMFVDEEEKKQLAHKAASFLKDNMTVFIDSSSTSHFLIPHIKRVENVKIFTNSVNALMIANKMQIPCFLIGGDYCEKEMCCIGPLAERMAEQINVDIAFISTLGITTDGFITDSYIEIIAVKEKIINNAGQTVFMFEKSKINKKRLYNLCHKDDKNISVITIE